MVMLILLFLSLCVSAGEPDWHVPGAEYRLVVESPRPADKGYFNFSDYALPILLSQGVDIRDQAGNKIPFYLHQTLGVLIGPAPDSPRRYIYFGLKELSPVDQWDTKKLGNIPPDRTLYLSAYSRGHNYQTGEEWLQNQVKWLDNRFSRQNNWMFNYLLQCIIDDFLSRDCPWRFQSVNNPLAPPSNVGDWSKPFDHEDYLCWRSRERSRRTAWFVEQEMKKSYADIFKYSPARLDWAWRRIHQSHRQIYSELPKLRQRAPEAPYNEFLNIFKPPYRNTYFTGNVHLFHMADEAFDSRRNLAAVYEGDLLVPETGDYEFKLETAASALLYINDKLLIKKYDEPELRKNAVLNLEAGTHKLRLCYQRPSSSVLTLSWKKPGTDDFEIMSDRNFAPGWPNAPVALQDSSQRTIPLVKLRHLADIHVSKTGKMLWQNLETVPALPDLVWLLNGRPILTGSTATMICLEDDAFGVMTQDYSPTRLYRLGYNREKPFYHADIALKLHIPDFIFDNEELDMFIEALSSIPYPAPTQFAIEPDRDSSMFKNQIRDIEIPAKQMTQTDRFATDGQRKFPVLLRGSELKKPLSVTLRLSIPELVFSEKTLRFIPIEKLPRLHLDADGNYRDRDEAIVIPVLHRPTLNELRSWELPISLKTPLNAPTGMLVVADDFGNFSTKLSEMLAVRNIQTSFLSWNQAPRALIRMRAALPALLPQIADTDCDTALIIPSAADIANHVPLRAQTRHLSALIQALRSARNIKTIYLSTPLPMENMTEEEQLMSTELRKIAREFGLTIVNLNHYLRNQSQLNYIPDPATPDYKELLPVGNINEICTQIIRETIR